MLDHDTADLPSRASGSFAVFPMETRVFFLSLFIFAASGIVDEGALIVVAGSSASILLLIRNFLPRRGRKMGSSLANDSVWLFVITHISQWFASQDQLVKALEFPTFQLSLFYDSLKIGAAVLWVLDGSLSLYRRPASLSDLPIALVDWLRITWRVIFMLLLVESLVHVFEDKWGHIVNDRCVTITRSRPASERLLFFLTGRCDILTLLELVFAVSLLIKTAIDVWSPVTSSVYRVPQFRAFEARRTRNARMRDSLLVTCFAIFNLLTFEALDDEWWLILLALGVLTVHFVKATNVEAKDVLIRMFGESKVGHGLREITQQQFDPQGEAYRVEEETELSTANAILRLTAGTSVVPLHILKGKHVLLVLGGVELTQIESGKPSRFEHGGIFNVSVSEMAKLTEKSTLTVVAARKNRGEFGHS